MNEMTRHALLTRRMVRVTDRNEALHLRLSSWFAVLEHRADYEAEVIAEVRACEAVLASELRNAGGRIYYNGLDYRVSESGRLYVSLPNPTEADR